MNLDSSLFANLSVPEKLQLVSELWEQIAESDESLPIPDWQKEELDRRKKNLEANPQSGIPWEEARRRIRESNG
jgi:putative addiction module component (TIGR02574 family)